MKPASRVIKPAPVTVLKILYCSTVAASLTVRVIGSLPSKRLASISSNLSAAPSILAVTDEFKGKPPIAVLKSVISETSTGFVKPVISIARSTELPIASVRPS